MEDILLGVFDGLKGFPETIVQTCIVHLLRHNMEFASPAFAEAGSGRIARSSPPH